MQFDGDALTIDLSMSMQEIAEFAAFVRPRLEFIERIEALEGSTLKRSALLAVLVSIKRAKPQIVIPFLEAGKMHNKHYGTMHFICAA
ncbi:MAG: hypothetical protein KU37_11655 [Sulfuricurvum sp. PC08-66]|nr:MAG: hypothetical protein KU37_11655 [Sulfuricurvum sp. PC08-66]